MRQIEDALIVRVAVDGRHEPALDAERIEQHPGDRRQAVGGARGVGDHLVLLRVVLLVVDAEGEREVLALGGRGDDHLLRAGGDVLLRVHPVGETARALEHDVAAVLLVRKLGRIALGGDGDLLAIDDDRVLERLDLALENPVHRVVLEEVRERLRLVDVVDVDDVEVHPALDCGAEDVATDASEAVDRDPSHEASVSEGLHRLRDPQRQAAKKANGPYPRPARLLDVFGTTLGDADAHAFLALALEILRHELDELGGEGQQLPRGVTVLAKLSVEAPSEDPGGRGAVSGCSGSFFRLRDETIGHGVPRRWPALVSALQPFCRLSESRHYAPLRKNPQGAARRSAYPSARWTVNTAQSISHRNVSCLVAERAGRRHFYGP